ncbi:MAG: hypothetical protein ACKOVB_09090 [Terrabacter sp.]
MLYLLEAASGTGKEVWVLDRPNPAGRPVLQAVQQLVKSQDYDFAVQFTNYR